MRNRYRANGISAWRLLALVGSMTLLLGCSGLPDLPELPFSFSSSATPVPTQPSTPTASPSPTPVETPTPTRGGVTLEFWVPDFLSPHDPETGAEILSDQVTVFSDINADLRVRMSVKKESGAGGLYDLMSAASEVAPSIMPDVVVLNSRDLKMAAQEGLVQPVDAYMPAEAGYFSSALTAVQMEDALWAFPYVARADQMAYREGVTTTAPLSWTTVLTANYTMLFPASPPEGLASDALLSIYMGSGGRVIDQAGQESLDRATLELVYGFFLDMQEAGLLDAELALSLSDASACWVRFQEGEGQLTPVPVTRFWQTRLDDALPSWPPTEAGDPATILHAWGLAIVTQDPVRREAALELMRWLVSAQHMAELSLATGLVPTRANAVDAWPLSPEDAAFLKNYLSSSMPALPSSVDGSVRRALQAGLTVLLEGEAETPAEAASYALTNLRR